MFILLSLLEELLMRLLGRLLGTLLEHQPLVRYIFILRLLVIELRNLTLAREALEELIRFPLGHILHLNFLFDVLLHEGMVG